MLENVSDEVLEVLYAEIKKRMQKEVEEAPNGVEQLIDEVLLLAKQLGEARAIATALRKKFCEGLELPWE